MENGKIIQLNDDDIIYIKYMGIIHGNNHRLIIRKDVIWENRQDIEQKSCHNSIKPYRMCRQSWKDRMGKDLKELKKYFFFEISIKFF